jgi:hypothetical protein
MADGLEGQANPQETISCGEEKDERIRSFDWSKTPLGPISFRSPSFRMMVGSLAANDGSSASNASVL